VDEVGRGALAGPLTVGAVVVTDDAPPPTGLADSKALTPAQREALVEPIRAWASAWSLGWASAEEVDQWGLRTALAVAATRALANLPTDPDLCLIDGAVNLLRAAVDQPPGRPAPPALAFATLDCRPIVRGDGACASIAAASVLAKVARDDAMVLLDRDHPAYGWARNKGYGVPEHLAALARLGPTELHRRTWRLPAPEQSEPGAFGAKE
ncbi:MAG: ribonuclease HII, partial [Acidimicrobiales bacterium]